MQGVVGMRVEEVLSRLEKHEAECNLRYKRIEERLDDQKELVSKNSDSLTKLDIKIWGLAILIIVSPFAAKLWS
jgi:hypothetical protein